MRVQHGGGLYQLPAQDMAGALPTGEGRWPRIYERRARGACGKGCQRRAAIATPCARDGREGGGAHVL